MSAALFRACAACGVAFSFLLGACSVPVLPSSTPQLDAAFGESVRQARAMQTVDAEAGRKAGPVVGIDGEAARNAMDEYQKGFKEPPRTFNILGIGGSTMSSSP